MRLRIRSLAQLMDNACKGKGKEEGDVATETSWLGICRMMESEE